VAEKTDTVECGSMTKLPMNYYYYINQTMCPSIALIK